MERATHALVREPGDELVEALAMEDRGRPDPELARAQHRGYVAALEAAGLTVSVRPADPAFPDGCFPEDTHLVLPDAVVRLAPGAPSRAGEPEGLAGWLPTDRERLRLGSGASLDGGDVLRMGKRLWVGLSKRTRRESAEELRSLLAPRGYRVEAVAVPELLHLKSGCTSWDEGRVVATRAFAAVAEAIAPGGVFLVPEGEETGANLLAVNDTVLVAAGCPRLVRYLEKAASGRRIVPVDLSETNKVDGMLTCLSLVWEEA